MPGPSGRTRPERSSPNQRIGFHADARYNVYDLGLGEAKALLARGVQLEYADPRVPQIQVGGQLLKSVAWAQADLTAYDLVVLLTAHPEFEPARPVRDARLVLDTRNATGAQGDFRHVIKI